ncbi:MAG TPA: ATP-binding cassette domain-containing protein [Acidobacteriaceae bacterium]
MSERAHLKVEFRHRVGALELDVAFLLREPWTVLFGPSGSGKTTVLRVIAGFVRPDAGRIVSRSSEGELVMTDTARGVFLKPHERMVRTAGQGAALFPHLTVRDNIAFGVQGQNSVAIADEAITRFRLQELTEKVPSMLSGGERQRVAIARAATAAVSAGSGCVLLLDEPFTGQDVPLRDELIEELRGWLVPMQTPVLSVTHDVGEAFQLGAEVVKIADGRVVQQGPVAEVLAEERTRLLEQLRAAAGSRA